MLSLKSTFHAFSLALVFLPAAHSYSQRNYSSGSLVDALPELSALSLPPPSLSPIYGGLDFNRCCMLAVNSSIAIVNGSLEYKEATNFIDESDRQNFQNVSSQFPCGATYDGDRDGTARVRVPYQWCADNCRGWQISQTKKLNQWVGPLVGFILPAVVFCLEIPRRRKLLVSTWFFHAPIDRISNIIKIPIIAWIAAMLVTMDTVVWLSICLTLAGPMLVSGIYEAFLDSRILSYLHSKIENGQLTIDMRARILYLILVGNLDLDFVPSGDGPEDNAWTHVEELTDSLRIYPSPRQHSLAGEVAVDVVALHQGFIRSTKTRLRTMLACQYS